MNQTHDIDESSSQLQREEEYISNQNDINQSIVTDSHNIVPHSQISHQITHILSETPRVYKNLYEGLIISSYKFPHELYNIIINTFDSKRKTDYRDISKEMYSMIGFIHYFSDLHDKVKNDPINGDQMNMLFQSLINRAGGNAEVDVRDSIKFSIEWKLEVYAPKGWEENSYFRDFQNEKTQSQYNLLFKRYQYIVKLALHIREKYIDFMESLQQKMNIEFLIDMAHLFDIFYTYVSDYSKFSKSLGMMRDKKKFKSFFKKNDICKVSVNLNMKNNYTLSK